MTYLTHFIAAAIGAIIGLIGACVIGAAHASEMEMEQTKAINRAYWQGREDENEEKKNEQLQS